ncbi:MAG TPA: hypothetical protein VK030_02650 [Actinomycetales bacterium]|nr:hypothetical protein [Actinomycetales bacterium]
MSEKELQEETKPRPQIRMGTIVWGLIVVALGVLLIMWDRGMKIHPQVAGVAILFGAGALLIVGSVITALRKNGDD